MSVLENILSYKREEVAARKRLRSIDAFDRQLRAQGLPKGFAKALADAAPKALIGEIKKASPSKGLIRGDFDASALAIAYRDGGAHALSVLTDAPSFQGSEENLRLAAGAAPALPILRKDFMIDPWQIAESRAIGADAILIIMAAVDDGLAGELFAAAGHYQMDALVETHDETELDRALALGAQLIGINNRSLANFVTDLGVTERLAVRAPRDRLIVAESGIHTASDIARLQRAGAGAFLVGESLMRQSDVAAATRALLS